MVFQQRSGAESFEQGVQEDDDLFVWIGGAGFVDCGHSAGDAFHVEKPEARMSRLHCHLLVGVHRAFDAILQYVRYVIFSAYLHCPC